MQKDAVHTDPYWKFMVRTSTSLINPIGNIVQEIQLVFKQKLYIFKKKPQNKQDETAMLQLFKV